ncbi:MAG: nuclear transport factor 2 family protein [Pseudorhodoplanes sp.]|uniref:nuclear transport factor 2 family protein n=1 Tax=Pseudorhodoplanes sp. TaxID=1934341 RepID=UPI003D0A9396
MGEAVTPATVHAFYQALASRDPVRLAPYLADDVEWHMAGPVDLFVFCGYRRGKAAVVDYIGRLVPSMFSVRRFEPAEVVIDGDTAALLNNVTSVQKGTGRILTYQTAVFVVFRDGKVVSLKGVSDTFDMAEQVVGHRIDPYREPRLAAQRDVIAL